MENKVLEKNLEIIKSYDPNLANKILITQEEKSNFSKYSISLTQKQEYNLLFENVPIHSPQGAIEEAKNIIKNLDDKKNSIHIIFGLGLGYLLDELSSKTEFSTIILYEPDIALLKLVLALANIDALEKRNVFLCNDKESFQKLVFNHSKENTEISISFLNFYKEKYKSEIQEFLSFAQIEQGKHQGNKNTFIKKAPSAVYHTFSNLKSFKNSFLIEDLKNSFEGGQALILSAGPSLAKNIELVKKYKDKFTIFAVGTVLKLMLENDIMPDFIIDIESWRPDIDYSQYDFSNTYMILEAFSHQEKFYSNSKGNILYLSKENFLNNWVRKLFNSNSKEGLKTLGTVTYDAINSAYILGFKDIVLLGSDLAFQDGSCYSKGSRYEDLECVFLETENKYEIRAKDFEEYAFKLFNSKSQKAKNLAKKRIDFLNQNLYSVKSFDGKILPTQTSYAIFIKYFEELANEINKEVNLYNCSKGAKIEGFEDIGFEKLANQFEKKEKIKEINLKNKTSFDEKKANEDKDLILAHLEEYQEINEEILSLCKKILQEIEIKKTFTQNAIKLIKKHNEQLKLLLKFQIREDLALIFVQYSLRIVPIIENLDMGNILNYKKTLEDLKAIYEKIEKDIEKYKKALTDC